MTTRVEAGATSEASVVTVAVVGASVGLDSGAGGLAGSGFGGSFVGVGSTIALTTTVASGVGVSAV